MKIMKLIDKNMINIIEYTGTEENKKELIETFGVDISDAYYINEDVLKSDVIISHYNSEEEFIIEKGELVVMTYDFCNTPLEEYETSNGQMKVLNKEQIKPFFEEMIY